MSWCHDGKTVFSLKNMRSAPVQKRKKWCFWQHHIYCSGMPGGGRIPVHGTQK